MFKVYGPVVRKIMSLKRVEKNQNRVKNVNIKATLKSYSNYIV